MLRELLGLAVVLALVSATSTAAADRARRPDNFWEWVNDPHKAEVNTVLQKVADIRATIAQEAGSSDVEHYQAVQKKGLKDALGMLEYALRLQPDNAELMERLGYVAYDMGRVKTARGALGAYLKNQVPERIKPEVHARLGRLEAGAQNWGEATVQLLLALGSTKRFTETSERTQTFLCLASVYMHTGRMAEAIDLLENAIDDPALPGYDGGWAKQFLQFTLAVAYDRDDQVTRAHDHLDQLLRAVGSGGRQAFLGLLSSQGYSHGQPMEFTPVFDRHYFTALLYEATDHLVEARAEWRAYARHGERAPHRKRALAHASAIDALLTDRLGNGRKPGRKSR